MTNKILLVSIISLSILIISCQSENTVNNENIQNTELEYQFVDVREFMLKKTRINFTTKDKNPGESLVEHFDTLGIPMNIIIPKVSPGDEVKENIEVPTNISYWDWLQSYLKYNNMSMLCKEVGIYCRELKVM